ncbi:MAG: hemolysin family protein [Trichodesmium sp. St16_bin4-tuft]|nr:hemolysin family protein [Trichodesmium sp. MAG_R01]MDE5068367.1 hemolysin family protein [Trichodesmium sp. St4_bin8_1]MDE5073102.1 hemolysin family protein [Trichodesmium sp. St5_bin8]MDE5077031.1 hemolysin family protein [Trichodesmium sp. St2_bin6]MDE5091133.1 hemolysin family protein [Trichodesmium sp. St18_bin3_1_1]MDE5100959.1 hemolysin family protein [Trichodesmium sp. St16_bin4-tuft]MDE5103018.1 hemolysin family protein [Trichodesmium sp. St19_bin2]
MSPLVTFYIIFMAEIPDLDILSQFLLVFLLITINAFFVLAEFSIVSVRRSRINQLVDAGDVQAKIVQQLQRHIERLLSTTQLGITLSSFTLGWIGAKTMVEIVKNAVKTIPLPIHTGQGNDDSVAITIVTFLILAYLQIVLGELCPKSVALIYSEQLSRLLGPLSIAISRLFNPFIWILNQSTYWLLRLLGIRYTGSAWKAPVTSEELQLIISTSTESIGLEAEERQLLSNVFEFGEVLAVEIMVPRTNIDTISSTATFQDLLNEVQLSGHSRYPVVGESIDDIQGIIDFKELAKPLAKGLLCPKTSILSWVRPARFVSEQTYLNELLSLMQRMRQISNSPQHPEMVIVVDEFGGTAGLITREDLIAEIISSDSYEVTDSEELALQMLDDQTFIVQAQLSVEEVNELLNLDLPVTEDYQTLGGFLIYQLQKIPTQGEKLHYKNLEFTVISAEGQRLDKINICQLEGSEAETTINLVLEDEAGKKQS